MKGKGLEKIGAEKPLTLNYPDYPLPGFLLDTVARHPDYIATTFNDIDITYRELNDKVNGFAHALVSWG